MYCFIYYKNIHKTLRNNVICIIDKYDNNIIVVHFAYCVQSDYRRLQIYLRHQIFTQERDDKFIYAISEHLNIV